MSGNKLSVIIEDDIFTLVVKEVAGIRRFNMQEKVAIEKAVGTLFEPEMEKFWNWAYSYDCKLHSYDDGTFRYGNVPEEQRDTIEKIPFSVVYQEYLKWRAQNNGQ